MNNFMNEYFTSSFIQGLQNFIIALIVLLIGWLIAKAIANMVEKGLGKTQFDDRFINMFRTDTDKPLHSEKIIGKSVYYILLLVVFILFFNVLNLNMIANPLSDLISTIFHFVPAVLKAALILLLAWAIATVVQWFIVKGTKKLNLQHLFFKIRMAKTEEEIHGFMETIGKVAFYLILLLFIPGVLDALNIQGVAQPFSGLLGSILAFIPKLLAATIIFTVGWFVAKIVKNIVVNLLQAVGSEGLIYRLKMQKLFEGTSFASFVGNLVFIIILIPITIAALEKLELKGITDPAIGMLHDIMAMIPNILIAVALILFGIWLGRFIGNFVQSYLSGLGFDRLVNNISVNNRNMDTKMTPSALAGYVIQILIVFFLTVQALYIVKLDFLVGIATAITAYLPSVLAAVLILGVALILASLVEKVLQNILAGPATRALAVFAKYAILALAVFMAVSQLGIATTIVNAAFILILGGLSLAFGLAFGLGGKDFAGKYLRKFDHTIDETKVKENNTNPNQNHEEEHHTVETTEFDADEGLDPDIFSDDVGPENKDES